MSRWFVGYVKGRVYPALTSLLREKLGTLSYRHLSYSYWYGGLQASSQTMNTVDAAAAIAGAYTRVCTHEGCCPESIRPF